MGKLLKQRITRENWLHAALEALTELGLLGIKIVPLSKTLGVTSGSFYWHFKDRRDLQMALLDYWEVELTDIPMEVATNFDGAPKDRILFLMEQIIALRAARCDHAISIWANTDKHAQVIFERVMKKRFKFAQWMFKQAGFSDTQAKLRGRLYVAYLMGETTIKLGKERSWKEQVKKAHNFITE